MGFDSDLLMLWAACGLVGLAVLGLGRGVLAFRTANDPLRRRLRPSSEAATVSTASAESSAPPIVATLTRLVRGDEKEASRLKRELTQAGYRGPKAIELFLAAKIFLAVLLPAAFLVFDATQAEPVRAAAPIAISLCAAGFLLPNGWLSSRVKERRRAIEVGLPDTLDLMVTCVEAGLGLDAALLRVANDSSLSAPALSDELNLTFLEVKAGISRTESFRRLYDRTGCDELKSLAATLAQAEMFGTSIGTALRVQASEIRVRRTFRAEERAAIVAVKLTLPLVFCILPSLLAIVMGPGVINIYESMFAGK